MREPEKLDFFFGNLVYLLNEAGISKRALSVEIGAAEDFISTLLLSRQSPSLDTVYAIASVLKCDVADLLRPGPQIGVTGEDNKNYWVERTAEEYLSSALNKTR
ncbi:MAG: helix-turn-helix transcriptional regulator, partial [Pseudomonadota bacterium]